MSGELIDTAAAGGATRASQTLPATLAMSFLAGAYIALGGFLAVRCGAMLPWEVWGSMGKLVFAMVFPLGLMLTVICGADLFTGNCLSLTAAWERKTVSILEATRSGVLSWIGNFAGALFVAWAMAVASGLIFETAGNTMPWAASLVKLANAKTALPFDEAFWRAVGCNWLVCLAVFAAYSAKDTAGKIVALWIPTMAFVALGMEHCVANMFFIPAALMTAADPRYAALAAVGQVPELTATVNTFLIDNLIPVTLGNIVGGAVLVAGFYCFIKRAR